MRGKKYVFIFSLVIAIIVLILFLYPKVNIKEENIISDVKKQIEKTLKNNQHIIFNDINMKIELTEDVLDKRFIVYSFYNPMVGYRHAGYAVYDILNNKRFRRSNFGWNNEGFEAVHLIAKQNNEVKMYLMVYGMNKEGEKQVYKYTHGKEERIEEFSGDYFIKKYIEDEYTMSFTNLK